MFAADGRELAHRDVHLLLHGRLVELAQEGLALREFLLQGDRVLADRIAGAAGRSGRRHCRGLELLHLALERDAPVGEGHCGSLEAGGLLLAPITASSVGEGERLAGRCVGLLEIVDRSIEPDLELLLVCDDVGGLLRQQTVLLASVGDGLFELDLRVGASPRAVRRAWRPGSPTTCGST